MIGRMKRALLVIDLQNDFLPGGALAVAKGDEVIPVANQLIASGEYDVVCLTQDWHPKDHGSFAANTPGMKPFESGMLNGLPQVFWPVHCVQGTTGAEFAADLSLDAKGVPLRIFRKGTNPAVDSYSGFFDNAKRGDTGLQAYLASHGIADVDVLGLATDFCVQSTVLDALDLGYRVRVIERGCRAVFDQAGAIRKMREKGAAIV
jgi:nicotinamidase/pyrazinamidase